MVLEKAIVAELRRMIRALKWKVRAFKEKGDLSRAESCMFLARYLEDFIRELEG